MRGCHAGGKGWVERGSWDAGATVVAIGSNGHFLLEIPPLVP